MPTAGAETPKAQDDIDSTPPSEPCATYLRHSQPPNHFNHLNRFNRFNRAAGSLKGAINKNTDYCKP